jgi:hypothetical protein
MVLIVPACEKLLRHYQVLFSKREEKRRKMEGDFH